MYAAGIRRVLFLLPDAAPLLLPHYHEVLGTERVFHEPIEDLTLPEMAQLQRIMEILSDADTAGEKIVVHCMAGIGRTGVVLAGSLVYRHGMSPADAVSAVTSTDAHRDPHEATLRGAKGRAALETLLASVRR
jgi:protein-tyrosine phosphatase